ncbi:hypothetical protein [Sulfurimonas sp.]|uniref:hypothetical protein n=1 Tax=Sulfurimonas sp. TaxID=2022749 RepID=UPI0025CBB50F|nr:hypothetical protein [Sulfurimonas sp.]MBW6489239.1 hypothetical protein [Sulfurimonas sp.]
MKNMSEEMIDFNKFKIEIYTNRETPITKNVNLFYIKDETIDELFVKVYYGEMEIGQGIVLDFYKEFVNIESNGQVFTQIKTFPFHGSAKEKYTHLGNQIYQLKYLKNPPVAQSKRELYINEFVDNINIYMPQLLEITPNLKLAYIPSSLLVPDDIAKELSRLNSLTLESIILKNSGIDSKNITTFEDGIKNSILKYSLNKKLLNFNSTNQYIIIDDVMGSGSSIATVLKKLYDMTQKTNYFFIVAKDVKR